MPDTSILFAVTKPWQPICFIVVRMKTEKRAEQETGNSKVKKKMMKIIPTKGREQRNWFFFSKFTNKENNKQKRKMETKDSDRRLLLRILHHPSVADATSHRRRCPIFHVQLFVVASYSPFSGTSSYRRTASHLSNDIRVVVVVHNERLASG